MGFHAADLLFDAFWCFSGFSSKNMHLNDLSRVHVFYDFASRMHIFTGYVYVCFQLVNPR